MATPRRGGSRSGPRGSFTVRMQHRARQIELGLKDVKVDTAVALVGILSRFTPKDSGRARANWNVGVGKPDESVDLEGPFRSSQETEDAARARASRARPGEDIHVTNALPYLPRLNRGSSRKAPAGFVERAVRVARQTVVEARLFGRFGGGE